MTKSDKSHRAPDPKGDPHPRHELVDPGLVFLGRPRVLVYEVLGHRLHMEEKNDNSKTIKV